MYKEKPDLVLTVAKIVVCCRFIYLIVQVM